MSDLVSGSVNTLPPRFNNPNTATLFPLAIAAIRKGTGMMEALLDAGADINGVAGNENFWPLDSAWSRAFHTEEWENYEFLLERGVDVNLVYGGDTMMDYMMGSGNFDRALNLLERGYNLNYALHLRIAKKRNVNDIQQPYKQKFIETLEERLLQING